MTNGIFHVTVAALVGTMAVFGIAIATAQSNRLQNWGDLLKPYEAKTNTAVPIAPPSPPVALDQPMTRQTRGGDNALLDSCVMDAIGLLPKIEGSRVVKSSYEFRNSVRDYDFYHVLLAVEFQGRQASYTYVCRVKGNEYSQVLGRQ